MALRVDRDVPAAVAGTLGELRQVFPFLAAAAGIDADHLQAIEDRADQRIAEQLLHGDEGDARNLGGEQDAVAFAVVLVGQQHRSAGRQIFTPTDLDLHAANPAHAPDHGARPIVQQAAQQHRGRDRDQKNAEDRRNQGADVEVGIESQGPDHGE